MSLKHALLAIALLSLGGLSAFGQAPANDEPAGAIAVGNHNPAPITFTGAVFTAPPRAS